MIRFRATWILQKTIEDLRKGKPYIWHEGGTRSGKTHNIVGAALIYANETGAALDVVRATNTALKGSIYVEDLLPVARALGYYDEKRHNKTDQFFLLPSGARVRYFGVDDEQKVRGWKRDVLLMNEANEISDEKRRQLWMRTTRSIIVEHNPTVDDDHWIVRLLTPLVEGGECSYYHSTYKDNLPFLPASQVRIIEQMEIDDPYGWQVYGLGLRGSNPAAVFERVHLGVFDSQKETVYGVDFGSRDPFVVCEWGWRDASPPARPHPILYCRPLVYMTHCTTSDAIAVLNAKKADKAKPMYCDSSEPDRIMELQRAGYRRAKAIVKRQGAREAGFAWMKAHTIIVDQDADEAEPVRLELKRTRHYKKPGSDTYTDKVVDADDHVGDSGRYGAFEAWGPKVDARPAFAKFSM